MLIYHEIIGNTSPIVQDIYANIGNCWEEKGHLERAIIFYEKATLIASKVLHNRFEFTDFSLSSISQSYIKLGEKEERIGNFNKAIEFYQKGIKHIETFNISESKYDLRDLHFKIAKFLMNQQNFQLSIDYLKQCLAIDEEDLDSCFCIAQSNENINQQSSAFEYYLKTIVIFESVCFDDIENWINGINVFDETTKINPFIKAKDLAYLLNKVDELPDWLNESNI